MMSWSAEHMYQHKQINYSILTSCVSNSYTKHWALIVKAITCVIHALDELGLKTT